MTMSAVSGAGPLARRDARAWRYESVAAGFVLPALVLVFVTTVGPLAAVIVLSFTDYQLGAIRFDWVGAENFVKLFSDAGARRAFNNTLIFTAMVVPASVGLGLLFALLINDRLRTRRFYELMFFLPLTATMSVMAIVWSFLLHGRIGPVNALLTTLGLPRIDFLSDPATVLPTLALLSVWQHMAFCLILFLAGLTAVPRDLYEAAALDGADRGWEKFRRVTWPLLAPTTFVVVLLTTIRAFQVFDNVVILTQGGPAGASEVILYEMYLQAFSYFRIGYACALTLVFVLMVGLVSALQFWAGRRRSGQ